MKGKNSKKIAKSKLIAQAARARVQTIDPEVPSPAVATAPNAKKGADKLRK